MSDTWVWILQFRCVENFYSEGGRGAYGTMHYYDCRPKNFLFSYRFAGFCIWRRNWNNFHSVAASNVRLTTCQSLQQLSPNQNSCNFIIKFAKGVKKFMIVKSCSYVGAGESKKAQSSTLKLHFFKLTSKI